MLPRGHDVCLDARVLYQGHAMGRSTFDAEEVDIFCPPDGDGGVDDNEQEMIGGDMVDGYQHLAVHPAELEACLSWSDAGSPFSQLLLWTRLFFGLRAAPVVFCRFGAAYMRLVMSVFDPHCARGNSSSTILSSCCGARGGAGAG